MANPHEEFVLYLEKNPECYVIMKSSAHIKVLETLEKRPNTLEGLKILLAKADLSDLELIIDSLLEIGAVDKFLAGQKYMFNLTKKGKDFLAKYTKTRQAMLGSG